MFWIITSRMEMMLIMITRSVVCVKLTERQINRFVSFRLQAVAGVAIVAAARGESFNLKRLSNWHKRLQLSLLYINFALIHELKQLGSNRVSYIFENDFGGREKNRKIKLFWLSRIISAIRRPTNFIFVLLIYYRDSTFLFSSHVSQGEF